MSKNDYNPEEEQEQQIEEEEVAESTEETTDDSSSLEALQAAQEALRAEKEAAEAEAAKYRRLLNKAQRKAEPKKETSSETSNESRDDSGAISREQVEEMLLAKEYDEEELEEIKDIARGKGLTYAEAIATPIFKTWKEARDQEKRRQDAALGSSKGGAYSRSKEVPQDREAHKEWFLKNFG